MNDKNRRTSLPRWAQDEMNAQDRIITKQRTEIFELKSMIGHMGKKPEGSTVGVDYIGDNVLWMPPKHRHLAVDIDGFQMRLSTGINSGTAATGKGLQVMVQSHHGLLVRPQASNTVHLEPGR